MRYRGYQNVVWNHNEELPISYELNFGDIIYSLTFTGIGGKFEILEEKISSEKWVIQKRQNRILANYSDIYRYRFSLEDRETYESPIGFDWRISNSIYQSVTRRKSISRRTKEKMRKELDKISDLFWEMEGDDTLISIYKFIPENAKTSMDISRSRILDFDGNNLHWVLFHLFLRGIPSFMEDYIKLIFPEIEKANCEEEAAS